MVFLCYGLLFILLLFSLASILLPEFIFLQLIGISSLWICAEAVVYIYFYFSAPDIKQFWIPTEPGAALSVADPLFGFRAQSNVSGRVIKKINGKLIFDAEYTIDALGRRVTPGFSENDGDFLLFFGGSRTFGYGVSDQQTIPFYVSEGLGRKNVYNYSFSGWGPPQILTLLEQGKLQSEISGEQGDVVLLMIGSHIRRSVGTLHIATRYNGGFYPRYTKDAQGAIVRDGMFINRTPFKTMLKTILSKSWVWYLLNPDDPLKPEDYQFAAELLLEIHKKLREQFTINRFIVFSHPDDLEAEHLGKILAGHEIEFHSLNSLFKVDPTKDSPLYHSMHDTHLTGLGNRLVAEAMEASLAE